MHLDRLLCCVPLLILLGPSGISQKVPDIANRSLYFESNLGQGSSRFAFAGPMTAKGQNGQARADSGAKAATPSAKNRLSGPRAFRTTQRSSRKTHTRRGYSQRKTAALSHPTVPSMGRDVDMSQKAP